MKVLSLDEISICSGGFTPCFCYKGQDIKKYDGSSKMFKTIMCWYTCCNIDEADFYQWGSGGTKERCGKIEENIKKEL